MAAARPIRLALGYVKSNIAIRKVHDMRTGKLLGHEINLPLMPNRLGLRANQMVRITVSRHKP